ncbi:MAG TPA: DUF2934 domain-containing protein [Vicinamibacterales bacterium]|nr:DUF2934 domain-containing protein [Vicinamibacterales bacterium]
MNHVNTPAPEAVSTTPDETMSDEMTAAERPIVDPDRIAARAYELYLARGGMDGLDQDDWFQAERELQARQRDRQE